MAYKITTGPSSEPVTLADAKAWLKIHPDDSDDDELVRSIIAAARKWAEAGSGKALLVQTITEAWDNPCLRCYYLSIGPLVAVTTFQYRAADGTYTTWPSTNYTVDDITEPGRVVLKNGVTVPYTSMDFPNMVKITYTAGAATAAEVDPNIKTAMLLQISMMYDKREDMPLGKEGSATARSAWNLLAISRISLM